MNTEPLARELTRTRLLPDQNGMIELGDAPGLGIEVDMSAVARYVVAAEIRIRGEIIYATPALA